jgi:hypothetical protein
MVKSDLFGTFDFFIMVVRCFFFCYPIMFLINDYLDCKQKHLEIKLKKKPKKTDQDNQDTLDNQQKEHDKSLKSSLNLSKRISNNYTTNVNNEDLEMDIDENKEEKNIDDHNENSNKTINEKIMIDAQEDQNQSGSKSDKNKDKQKEKSEESGILITDKENENVKICESNSPKNQVQIETTSFSKINNDKNLTKLLSKEDITYVEKLHYKTKNPKKQNQVLIGNYIVYFLNKKK